MCFLHDLNTKIGCVPISSGTDFLFQIIQSDFKNDPEDAIFMANYAKNTYIIIAFWDIIY